MSISDWSSDVCSSDLGEASDLGRRLRGEIEALAQATANASSQVKRLKDSQVKAGRDAFLRTATKMVDELNTLSAAIHALLDADVPDEVWQSYKRSEERRVGKECFRTGKYWWGP